MEMAVHEPQIPNFPPSSVYSVATLQQLKGPRGFPLTTQSGSCQVSSFDPILCTAEKTIGSGACPSATPDLAANSSPLAHTCGSTQQRGGKIGITSVAPSVNVSIRRL